MGIAQWMRVIDTIGNLAQMSGKLLPKAAPEGGALATQEPGVGRLETRLAGVVVAALKEAFDRDRARMDLERAQIETERRRIEEALATEIRRQASERALSQLRLIAVMAVARVDAVGRARRLAARHARGVPRRCWVPAGCWRSARWAAPLPAPIHLRVDDEDRQRHVGQRFASSAARPPRRGPCCSRSRPSVGAFWQRSEPFSLTPQEP